MPDWNPRIRANAPCSVNVSRYDAAGTTQNHPYRNRGSLIGYDFTLFTNKNVPEKTVYMVAKALVEGVKDLHAVSPVWRSFNAERAQKDQGYEYHAGAMRAYKEKGLWKR